MWKGTKQKQIKQTNILHSEGARPILGSDLPGIQVRLTRNPSQKDILDSYSGNFYPMGPFSGSNLTREFLECRENQRDQLGTENPIHLSGQSNVLTLDIHRLWWQVRKALDLWCLICQTIPYCQQDIFMVGNLMRM